jgi:hypothetical protein
MPNSDFRAAMRRLHDVYHAPTDADIHPTQRDNPAFRDHQPGTSEFSRTHLVGPGQAPEQYIERIDGVGPEGLGVVELIDGRTGRPIGRMHKQMEQD